ncbi:MAG: MltA domain-containing protein [Aliarcobacter sp.]|jgi:membrane-bound lytic murein transglycosylase A|nr:MltA domain-containing protein [Aliarcobacter sp.]
MKFLIFISLTTLFLFSGCATKEEIISQEQKTEETQQDNIKTDAKNMQAVTFNDIDGFYRDDLNHALEVFKKDCKKSKKNELFMNVCHKAEYETDGYKFFTINFQPYKLLDSNSSDEGTITGYYEPLLYGSLQKNKRYKYPVYKTPKDMMIVDFVSAYPELKTYKLRGKLVDNRVIPYDSREEIEKNPNKNLEVIAYVDNKFDLFLLHVQGSGKILLDNGELINVGYAEQNGRKFKGIGTYMLNRGYITKDELSAQGMKKYIDKNPSKADEILNQNESYVFFKKSNQGATGALGSVLTAKRNLAVDRSVIPLGMPVFLSTKNPVDKKPINQLMVAADVGGAIKGDIRADFFWGYGEDAFAYAGKMKEKGKMYILMPKK